VGWRSLLLLDITRIVTRRMKMHTIMINLQQRLRFMPIQRIIHYDIEPLDSDNDDMGESHWIIHSDTIQVSVGLHLHPGFIETRRRRAVGYLPI